jgi:3-methyladenine DNA glycosylase AlkD
MITEEIRQTLFEMQDEPYADFIRKLIPTLPKESIIGVRTPVLRKYEKTLRKREDIEVFLNDLPHRYYEENQLHCFLLSAEKDYERSIGHVRCFLPFVDNWATCDSMSPVSFRKHKEELLPYIRDWVGSAETYTIRFGIGMLMQHFLDDAYTDEYPEIVASLSSEEYYVNMMRAWYFATALTKQYARALPFIENERLDLWTHNKAIQKAVESYQIPEDRKVYLKTLRRKASAKS